MSSAQTTGSRRKVKILMTGASGWIGQFIWQRFEQDYSQITDALYFDNSNTELYGTYSSHKPDWIPSDRAFKMDVQDEKEVMMVMSLIKPDVLIHLAAISFPNVCEKDPEQGERINNPMAIIQAIKNIVPDCFVIFTSSALVYDGENAPYKPSFDLNATPPICAYGKSKLQFERQILTLPRSTVIRLSNLLGPSCVYRHGEFKFMEWLYTVFKKREYMDFRHDEIRSFVFVRDVVDVVANLVTAAVSSHSFASVQRCSLTRKRSKSSIVNLADVYGRVFNVGGPRGLSRLDIAALVAEACKVELKIDPFRMDETHDDEVAKKKCWRIYKSSNIEGSKSSGVHNPRDGTIDSSETESVICVRFTDMREAIPLILSHWTKE